MRYCFLLVIGLVLQINTHAQTDRIDSLLNDLFSDDKEIMRLLDKQPVLHLLYTGIDYQNRTFYAGREIGDHMFTLNYNVSYLNSKGISIGASGSWYSDLVPAYNSTILYAGIYKPVNKIKNLYFRATYNRYLFNKPDTAIEYPFKNNISTGFSLRNKWVGAKINTNLLFGQDFGMNFSASIYSKIRIVRFGLYNDVTFSPEVLCFIASETVELESSGSLSPGTGDIQTTDVYGLLNTQLYLPLYIALGNFDICVSYSVNLPTSKDDNLDYPVRSSFGISLGYFLPVGH